MGLKMVKKYENWPIFGGKKLEYPARRALLKGTFDHIQWSVFYNHPKKKEKINLQAAEL